MLKNKQTNKQESKYNYIGRRNLCQSYCWGGRAGIFLGIRVNKQRLMAFVRKTQKLGNYVRGLETIIALSMGW